MTREKVDEVPFALIGEVEFVPEHSPEVIRVRKVRNLDRSENFCKGQDISDDGSENREIHITGTIIGDERDVLDRVPESDEPFDLASSTWSGEVRVSECEYEGPTGWHPESGRYYYEYTLDLIETGVQQETGSGIVEGPDSLEDSGIVEAGTAVGEGVLSVGSGAVDATEDLFNAISDDE